MLYVFLEEREAGCSCSPIEYKELYTILSKGGKIQDLTKLRVEYWEELNKINHNAYKKRNDFGNLCDWLIREKGFKKEEHKELTGYFS